MRKEMKKFCGGVAVACVVSLFTFGCSSKPVKVDQPDAGAGTAVGTTETKPAQTTWESGKPWPGPSSEESLLDTGYYEPELAVLEGRTSAPLLPVYFDFDRSNIRDDQENRMAKNAGYLMDNMGQRIKVEGNTDDRGTHEYNLALGERRAMSAKKYLMDMGIDAARMETLSYGEERPVSYGRDELSWSLNRRADFVFIK